MPRPPADEVKICDSQKTGFSLAPLAPSPRFVTRARLIFAHVQDGAGNRELDKNTHKPPASRRRAKATIHSRDCRILESYEPGPGCIRLLKIRKEETKLSRCVTPVIIKKS